MLSLGARLARQHGASRLARRLTSRAGPSDAALARAPPVLREYLSRPVVFRPVSKAAWRAYESEGMEKVLGIGPEVLEELRLRPFWELTARGGIGYWDPNGGGRPRHRPSTRAETTMGTRTRRRPKTIWTSSLMAITTGIAPTTTMGASSTATREAQARKAVR